MVIVFAALLGNEPDPSVDETEVQRLVRAVRTGNPVAARRLYTLHVGRVYRAVRPLCANDADTEDAVQEAFAAALSRLAEYQYRPETRFVAWLSTIAINVVRKRRQSAKRGAAATERLRAEDSASRAPGADELLARAQLREALLSALAQLPARDQEVLTLRYGAGLTAPEVAEALGLSSANVRKICERQREVLLARLKGLIEEPAVDEEEARDARG